MTSQRSITGLNHDYGICGSISFLSFNICCCSLIHISISCFNSSFASNSSTVKGSLVNGSWASLSRCCVIDVRSTTVLDFGKITGSFINVYNRGSKYLSGAKLSSIVKFACSSLDFILSATSSVKSHISSFVSFVSLINDCIFPL